jgi:hypothetical protein
MNDTIALSPEQKRLIQELIESYKPQKIFLNTASSSSENINLIVIKETNKPFYERQEEMLEIAKPNEDVCLIVYTPSELEKIKYNIFLPENLYKVGITLYDERENWRKSYY